MLGASKLHSIATKSWDAGRFSGFSKARHSVKSFYFFRPPMVGEGLLWGEVCL
jgi:hypothetical protein